MKYIENIKKEIPWNKIFFKTSMKTLEWSLIALGITLVGKHSFQKSYDDTIKILEEQQVIKEYHRVLEKLNEIDQTSNEKLSDQIYRIMSIEVEKYALFRELNEELNQVENNEELEILVDSYLKRYIGKIMKLEEENIIFYENCVYYNQQELELDLEAQQVIGSLLDCISEVEDGNKWKEVVIKKVIVTELYEKEASSGRELSLKLRKSERESL